MYKWTKHITKLKKKKISIFLNFLINKPEVITRWSLAHNRIRNAPIYYPENVENKWKIIFETWCEFSQIKIQNIVKHDAQYFHFFPSFFLFLFFSLSFPRNQTEDNQKTENQSQRSVILLINHPTELDISASCQFLVIFSSSSSFLFFCFLFFPQFSKQTKRG